MCLLARYIVPTDGTCPQTHKWVFITKDQTIVRLDKNLNYWLRSKNHGPNEMKSILVCLNELSIVMSTDRTFDWIGHQGARIFFFKPTLFQFIHSVTSISLGVSVKRRVFSFACAPLMCLFVFNFIHVRKYQIKQISVVRTKLQTQTGSFNFILSETNTFSDITNFHLFLTSSNALATAVGRQFLRVGFISASDSLWWAHSFWGSLLSASSPSDQIYWIFCSVALFHHSLSLDTAF